MSLQAFLSAWPPMRLLAFPTEIFSFLHSLKLPTVLFSASEMKKQEERWNTRTIKGSYNFMDDSIFQRRPPQCIPFSCSSYTVTSSRRWALCSLLLSCFLKLWSSNILDMNFLQLAFFYSVVSFEELKFLFLRKSNLQCIPLWFILLKNLEYDFFFIPRS